MNKISYLLRNQRTWTSPYKDHQGAEELRSLGTDERAYESTLLIVPRAIFASWNRFSRRLGTSVRRAVLNIKINRKQGHIFYWCVCVFSLLSSSLSLSFSLSHSLSESLAGAFFLSGKEKRKSPQASCSTK